MANSKKPATFTLYSLSGRGREPVYFALPDDDDARTTLRDLPELYEMMSAMYGEPVDRLALQYDRCELVTTTCMVKPS